MNERERPKRVNTKTALQYAVWLLSSRPYSERKLAEKLRLREYFSDDIKTAVERLKKERLLDDEKFAADFVRSRQNSRPRAASALIRDLLTRGIPMDIARKTVEAATSPEDEVALARQLVQRKGAHYDSLEPQVRWRRLGGLLARRGFSPDVIRKVLSKTHDE